MNNSRLSYSKPLKPLAESLTGKKKEEEKKIESVN
jgi:hypothetical protein